MKNEWRGLTRLSQDVVGIRVSEAGGRESAIRTPAAFERTASQSGLGVPHLDPLDSLSLIVSALLLPIATVGNVAIYKGAVP
uniref:Uncharacterized protein n=1 Tax=Knipowitschia caucasica TaxID=637954 RepID=A0AAV2L1S6_KNICA